MDDTDVDDFDRFDFADNYIFRRFRSIREDFDKLRINYQARRTNPEDADDDLRALIMRINSLKKSSVYDELPDKWLFEEVDVFPLDKEIQDYMREVLRHDIPAWTEDAGNRDDLPYFAPRVDKGLLEYMSDVFETSQDRLYDLADLEAEDCDRNDVFTANTIRRALKKRERQA